MPARAQSRSQGIRALVSSPHLPASEQSDVHEAVEKTQMRSGPTGIQVWALRPSARLPPLVSGLGFPAVGRDACLAHLSGPMEDRGSPDGEGGSKTVTLTFLLQETTHPSRLPHPPNALCTVVTNLPGGKCLVSRPLSQACEGLCLRGVPILAGKTDKKMHVERGADTRGRSR